MIGEKSHVGMLICFICGGDVGILLDRRLQKSLPRKTVGSEACDECKEKAKEYLTFVEATGSPKPGEPTQLTGRVARVRRSTELARDLLAGMHDSKEFEEKGICFCDKGLIELLSSIPVVGEEEHSNDSEP